MPPEILEMVVVTVAVELAILVGLPVLLMWIVNRFIGRKPAIGIGLIAAAAVLYLIVDTYWACKAPPIFVPSGGSTGEATIFPCDAPVGGLIHLFIWGIGPIAVALLVAVTIFHWVKFQRYQQLPLSRDTTIAWLRKTERATLK